MVGRLFASSLVLLIFLPFTAPFPAYEPAWMIHGGDGAHHSRSAAALKHAALSTAIPQTTRRSVRPQISWAVLSFENHSSRFASASTRPAHDSGLARSLQQPPLRI